MYKRISGLAGHTSRVSELLETVSKLSTGDGAATRRELYLRNVSSGNLAAAPEEDVPPATRLTGDAIKFSRYISALTPLCESIVLVTFRNHASPCA